MNQTNESKYKSVKASCKGVSGIPNQSADSMLAKTQPNQMNQTNESKYKSVKASCKGVSGIPNQSADSMLATVQPTQMNQTNGFIKTMCKFFIIGKCRKGSNCNHSHSKITKPAYRQVNHMISYSDQTEKSEYDLLCLHCMNEHAESTRCENYYLKNIFYCREWFSTNTEGNVSGICMKPRCNCSHVPGKLSKSQVMKAIDKISDDPYKYAKYIEKMMNAMLRVLVRKDIIRFMTIYRETHGISSVEYDSTCFKSVLIMWYKLYSFVMSSKKQVNDYQMLSSDLTKKTKLLSDAVNMLSTANKQSKDNTNAEKMQKVALQNYKDSVSNKKYAEAKVYEVRTLINLYSDFFPDFTLFDGREPKGHLLVECMAANTTKCNNPNCLNGSNCNRGFHILTQPGLVNSTIMTTSTLHILDRVSKALRDYVMTHDIESKNTSYVYTPVDSHDIIKELDNTYMMRLVPETCVLTESEKALTFVRSMLSVLKMEDPSVSYYEPIVSLNNPSDAKDKIVKLHRLIKEAKILYSLKLANIEKSNALKRLKEEKQRLHVESSKNYQVQHSKNNASSMKALLYDLNTQLKEERLNATKAEKKAEKKLLKVEKASSKFKKATQENSEVVETNIALNKAQEAADKAESVSNLADEKVLDLETKIEHVETNLRLADAEYASLMKMHFLKTFLMIDAATNALEIAEEKVKVAYGALETKCEYNEQTYVSALNLAINNLYSFAHYLNKHATISCDDVKEKQQIALLTADKKIKALEREKLFSTQKKKQDKDISKNEEILLDNLELDESCLESSNNRNSKQMHFEFTSNNMVDMVDQVMPSVPSKTSDDTMWEQFVECFQMSADTYTFTKDRFEKDILMKKCVKDFLNYRKKSKVSYNAYCSLTRDDFIVPKKVSRKQTFDPTNESTKFEYVCIEENTTSTTKSSKKAQAISIATARTEAAVKTTIQLKELAKSEALTKATEIANAKAILEANVKAKAESEKTVKVEMAKAKVAKAHIESILQAEKKKEETLNSIYTHNFDEEYNSLKIVCTDEGNRYKFTCSFSDDLTDRNLVVKQFKKAIIGWRVHVVSSSVIAIFLKRTKSNNGELTNNTQELASKVAKAIVNSSIDEKFIQFQNKTNDDPFHFNGNNVINQEIASYKLIVTKHPKVKDDSSDDDSSDDDSSDDDSSDDDSSDDDSSDDDSSDDE